VRSVEIDSTNLGYSGPSSPAAQSFLSGENYMVQSNTRMVSMSAPEQIVVDGQFVDQALINLGRRAACVRAGMAATHGFKQG